MKDAVMTAVDVALTATPTDTDTAGQGVFVDPRPGWDEYFLNIAAAVAVRADCTRRKVGAVVVDNGRRIVSTGYNGAPSGRAGCLEGACPRGQLSYDQVAAFTSYTTGPGRCLSLHAEVNAVLYAHRSLTDCTIFIVCQPCNDCAKVIAGAGIVRVVYPNPDGGIVSLTPAEILDGIAANG